ncbi:hypothetical protein Ccar_17755 [Clostridium carboxidivorans P7]|uniref:Tetratricopeptide repeat protein n=1 Tax=Clostridium carboxidivorans P7 TaxID=536227 RepID=C6PSE9_9CLOT|nr:hypothetical protein [Clostridium carboxidivorans]AKN32593.1 hypothetical protein Ccar_17755 [Clostridium carboxidivorans P7]EET87827.1 hypothetical protein CcarbDRAFT_1716 [Clostridium carboxidivorans P7]EFG90200.1 hypothetical protein CLCAR_0406 [Clostridium carboxidivorans P7]
MGWNIVSQNTEEVIDRNPDTYVKRAEKALSEGRVDEAVREVDSAIEYCDSSKKVIIIMKRQRFYMVLKETRSAVIS